MPYHNRVVGSIPYQHLRRVWREQQQRVRMKLFSAVQLRTEVAYRYDRMNRLRGPENPSEQNPILGTAHFQRGSAPAGTTQEMRGAVPPRTSSSGWRECPPKTTASLAQAANAFSYEVNARGALTDPYMQIAVTGGTDQEGGSIPADGASSWLPATHSGAADRQGRDRGGMLPYNRESLLRQEEHALQQSRARK